MAPAPLIPNGSFSESFSKLSGPSTSPTASMTAEELAKWNTSVRLLASLLRDHMVGWTPCKSPVGEGEAGLVLHGKADAGTTPNSPVVWIGLTQAGLLRLAGEAKPVAIFPDDLCPPILATTLGEETRPHAEIELSPARLLTHLRPVLDPLPDDDDRFDEICGELTNSAQNGRYWIEWYEKHSKPLSFKSSMMEWERALYVGHPLHPMHKSFVARDPVAQIPPQEITSVANQRISFVSVPGSDVRVTGPFRQALRPLLARYGIENTQPDRVILPCITMQIPAIKRYHPEMEVILQDALEGESQSALRTVSIPFFDYDLKFGLDVTISSSPRIVGPRTICIIQELTSVLKEIMPPSLWVMGEFGGVAGRSSDFDKSIHIGCLLRENLERRALANNETLAVVGALQEVPPGSSECNAALVYGLRTEAQKMKWLSEYTESVIDAVVGPVLDYGVAFEAHAQNLLMRMDRSTGRINGWVARDLNSIRIHMPTLAKSGYHIMGILPGSLIPQDDEHDVWIEIQMTLIQNQLNVWVYRLGLSRPEAWSMIRSKFEAFFERKKHENSRRLRDFLFAEHIPHKAFMSMKFAKAFRVYQYGTVRNVLLEGLQSPGDEN